MSVQKKPQTQPPGLYVGTDKHRWWKEAVVYQVRNLGLYPDSKSDINAHRYTLRLSLTRMAMGGVSAHKHESMAVHQLIT
jgi:hypothetical protein